MAVARIRVDRRQRRYRCTCSGVLIDRPAGEGDVRRGLVDQIVDGEGNDLGIGVAGCVGGLNRDVVALVGLEIDGCAGRNPDLVANDLEKARGVAGDGVGVAVACVGIDRREGRNCCAGSGIFIDRAAGQRDVGRVLVDQVVDRNRDDFTVGVTGRIRRLDRDVVALVGLEVDGCARSDTDLVADDLEEAGGVVGDGVGVGVSGIGVDGGQRGNRGAGCGVLVNRPAGQRDVGRGFVDQVVDGKGNDFRIGVAGRIGRLDRDVVRLVGLKVDVGAGRDTDLVADDLEEAGGIAGDGIGVAVAGIRVDRRERGDRRTRRRVLVNRAARQRDVGRGLIDEVVDRDGDDFTVGVAGRVRGLNRDVVGLVGLEVDGGAGSRQPAPRRRRSRRSPTGRW